MKIYGIIGAGGFGREIMPIAENYLRSLGAIDQKSELMFVIEDQFFSSQNNINGHRVVSMTDFTSTPASERYYNIAIGNSLTRERISSSIHPEIAKPFSIFAQNHISLCANTVGEGAIFCNYSQITSNAKIGKFFHGNIYSYIAHDCVIGDFVTFAPRVMCNGHVIIEDHAYIGTGAIIKDGTNKPIIIGRGATIGMGAVVTKSVPAGSTVIGNPARIMER